jgi:hypothetical protein
MPNYFLHMIQHLRMSEEVALWENGLSTTPAHEAEVVAFLANEYAVERLDYPGTAPDFEAGAALWAARTVYMAAQLVLYRQQPPHDLPALLPALRPISAAAVLSADLTLRFLPDIRQLLARIDPDDPLLPLLDKHLWQWHFSGIALPTTHADLDLSLVLADTCLRLRYTDRLIAYRRQPDSALWPLQESIDRAMGQYKSYFWPI